MCMTTTSVCVQYDPDHAAVQTDAPLPWSQDPQWRRGLQIRLHFGGGTRDPASTRTQDPHTDVQGVGARAESSRVLPRPRNRHLRRCFATRPRSPGSDRDTNISAAITVSTH